MKQAIERAITAAAFESAVLENGLTVLVHSMPGFTGVHAVYATHFGSIDRRFSLDGHLYELPAGVAHFLEHKMFENEDGDAFALYAKTGANGNAYTGFDKTCYVFSATDNIPENLDILLSFVSKPHFTEATVAKEQGIIGQEIKMYDDAADWRMLFAMYECLYQKHTVRTDIAGTVESIAEITPALLYACTDAFYRPQNMVLAVAGNVSLQTVLDACARAQIPCKTQPVARMAETEPTKVFCAYREFTMAVAKPMLGVGFKETPLAGAPREVARQEAVADLLAQLLCGDTTPLYRSLYDAGLVNADFSGEFLSVSGAACMVFAGETSEPEEVRRRLLREIARQRREGVSEEQFLLCKNMMYGALLADLEAVEDVAAGMAGAFLRGRTQADEISVLAELTKADVDAALQSMLREANSATVVIRPAQA